MNWVRPENINPDALFQWANLKLLFSAVLFRDIVQAHRNLLRFFAGRVRGEDQQAIGNMRLHQGC